METTLSYVTVPDPHPGRCLNFRSGGQPYFESRRCLELEGDVGHVCRFEAPRPPINYLTAQSFTYPKPIPWVVSR